MLVGTCPFGSRGKPAKTKTKSAGRREGRSPDQVKEKILGGCPFYPPYLSASVVQLLSRTLCKDPDHRITLSQIQVYPQYFLYYPLPDTPVHHRITLSQIQVQWQPRLYEREYT